MPSGETERVFFLVQNIQFSAGRANLLNWEGVGSDGRYRGTVSFSDLGCSVGSGERGGGGGGAPEGRRESCQNWLAHSVHILGKRRESLDEEISGSCGEGSLFSAYVFVKS